jgi:hypothetical protein
MLLAITVGWILRSEAIDRAEYDAKGPSMEEQEKAKERD